MHHKLEIRHNLWTAAVIYDYICFPWTMLIPKMSGNASLQIAINVIMKTSKLVNRDK